MAPSVYLETTIIGYLAMRVSSVLRIAANQQTTREWWDNHRHRYELYVSRFVIEECSAGDSSAAEERSVFLNGIRLLSIDPDVDDLADALLHEIPLPMKASVDAFHISIAAVHGIEYLLTWNCKHIANPSLRPAIERLCRDAGFEPPVICTPQELLEIDDVN